MATATECYQLAEVLAETKTGSTSQISITLPIQSLRELIDPKAKFALQKQSSLSEIMSAYRMMHAAGALTCFRYNIIERLIYDMDPLNTYRRRSYMSITDSDSEGIPMMFTVDVHENCRQRAQMGNSIELRGAIKA